MKENDNSLPNGHDMTGSLYRDIIHSNIHAVKSHVCDFSFTFIEMFSKSHQ